MCTRSCRPVGTVSLPTPSRYADIATSDGVPLVWGIRWTARPDQERVYGPELMRRTIAGTVDRGWRHYFYGSSPETLAALETAFKKLAPEARDRGNPLPSVPAAHR